MRSLTPRSAVAALVLVLLAQTAAKAQTAAANPYPLAAPPPISISNPFVADWSDGWKVACVTFTNTSDRAIKAVRFGVTTSTENPLGSQPVRNDVDVFGSFAPGVAIKPPTRFLGSVNRVSPALQNCWPTPRYKVAATIDISVVKIVYADGSTWDAPAPTTIATINY